MGSVSDKSWMNINNRFNPIYMEGVKKFIEFALVNFKNLTLGVIPCSCKKCYNLYVHNHNIVFKNIVINGFMSNYSIWSRHGENVVQLPSSSYFVKHLACMECKIFLMLMVICFKKLQHL